MDYAAAYQEGRQLYASHQRQQLLKYLAITALLAVMLGLSGRTALLITQGLTEQGFFDVTFFSLVIGVVLFFGAPIIFFNVFNPIRKPIVIGYVVIDKHLKDGVVEDSDFNTSELNAIAASSKSYIGLNSDERAVIKQALIRELLFVSDIFDDQTVFSVGKGNLDTPYDLDLLLSESNEPISIPERFQTN